MNDNAERLPQLGMDAKKWADEFCRLNCAADHGTMLGWFANAIMAGFDEANRRNNPSAPAEPAVESIVIDGRDAEVVLLPLDPSKAGVQFRIANVPDGQNWRIWLGTDGKWPVYGVESQPFESSNREAAVEFARTHAGKPITLKEKFQRLYDAGGRAWDDVPDPEGLLREIRGEPPQRVEGAELPDKPGVWFRGDHFAACVVWQAESGLQASALDCWGKLACDDIRVDELPKGHWSQPDAELRAECERLRAALTELREWHRHEYQSNPAIDARVDAALKPPTTGANHG